MRRGEAATQTAARSSDRLARARMARCEVVEHIREKAVMVSHHGRSQMSAFTEQAPAAPDTPTCAGRPQGHTQRFVVRDNRVHVPHTSCDRMMPAVCGM